MFTFGRHLGTLTQISIVLVSAQSLTAWRPFPRVYTGWHFGVCERGQSFTSEPSRAVLYAPSSLVADYPARYFERNERCPRSFGFLPLGQSQRNELHVRIPSDFHAPLEALHRAPVKIARLRVLPPRLKLLIQFRPSLQIHSRTMHHSRRCTCGVVDVAVAGGRFPCVCAPCGASTRREDRLPRPCF